MKYVIFRIAAYVMWTIGVVLMAGGFNSDNAVLAILGVGLTLYALVWVGLENLLAQGERQYKALAYLARKNRNDDAE